MTTSTKRTHHQVTFLVLALGVAAFALLQSLVIPALPTIREALGTSQTNVTWVLTAYLLSASIFTPIMGRLGDMSGKKRVFVVALVALALGSLLAALAPSLGVMIVARVIQGVGGGVLPLAFGIIRDEFPGEKVGGAVGLIAALSAIGAGFGIVLAGPIVSALSYHWLFWFPMMMVVVAAVAALLLVPESSERSPGRINWGAATLMSGWLVALLLAVSQAPVRGWISLPVLGLLAAAVVIGVVWVVVEKRSPNPLIDMRMMGVRSVWTTNLVALLFGIAMYAMLGFLPTFLQTPSSAGYGFGATVTLSGVMLLPNALMMFLVGLVAGRLAQRFGSRLVLVFGTVISLVGLLTLALAHTEVWEIVVATALTGIGFGLAFSSMSNIIVSAVPREQTGVASGMNANIRTIGGSLGAAVMASIVASGGETAGFPAESGYTAGFLVLAGAMLLAGVAGFFIPRITRHVVGSHLEEPPVQLRHAEVAMVAGGTVVGDESE
ncbi:MULTISPECIES: MFS transporter [unclassified Frigoribacterium]|uniref:MFS transporter n=1 Tax=unclassified Frigoribacterium TaxID=2627005 RepID=UPI000701B935|nr:MULTISPECIES: MFS transporter [unclassified Frigoribacterium]KQN41113.1 MFS transporter [Frigoribacterium sp. Leaf44]KQR44526.1 MFS transporter [Frigoribacterium sp. Leaf164]